MANTATAKVQQLPTVKTVVFGVDENCEPHAAWFPKAKAEIARAAAKQLGFNICEVSNGVAANLIPKLAEGRIHTAGPNAIPVVRGELYEQIVRALNSRGEAGLERGACPVEDRPTSWDAIKPGHVVLAQEGLVLGWWEAVVLSRANDKLTLRWRDYPKLPPVTVPVNTVALLNANWVG